MQDKDNSQLYFEAFNNCDLPIVILNLDGSIYNFNKRFLNYIQPKITEDLLTQDFFNIFPNISLTLEDLKKAKETPTKIKTDFRLQNNLAVQSILNYRLLPDFNKYIISFQEQEYDNEKIEELIHYSNTYLLREKIWKLTSFPIQDEQELFNNLFQLIGESIKPSRISLNLFNQNNESIVSYEWLKEGISASPDIPIPEDLWKFFIDRSDVDYISLQSLLELCQKEPALNNYLDFVKEAFEQSDLDNFIYFIYRINNAIEGYIVFDWCKQEGQERKWTDREIQTGIEMTKIVSKTLENIRSKKRLLESEEHFRSLMEHAKDYSIFRLKANIENPLNSEVVKISPSFLDFSGYDELESFNFAKWFERIHPSDIENIILKTKMGFEHPYLFNEFFRYIHPDKGTRWYHVRFNGTLDTNNNLAYINGLITDVTKEKQAEFELKQNEHKFRELFENTADAVMLLENHLITDCNTACVNMTGFSRDELVGKHPADISPVKQKNGDYSIDLSNKHLQKSDSDGMARFDWVHKRKNGELFEADILLSTIFIKGAPITQAVIRDISDRKQVEEKLIIEKNKAERSERIKADFLANMSHALRTPLNSIKGFSDLLINKEISEAQQTDYLKQVTSNSEQLISLIENYLDITKIENKQLKITNSNFSINKLYGEMLAELSAKYANKKVEYINNTETEVIEIYADKLRLRQITTNLCDHLLKYNDSKCLKIGFKIQDGQFYSIMCTSCSETKDICLEELMENSDLLVNFEENTKANFNTLLAIGLVKLFGGKLQISTGSDRVTYIFSLPYQKPIKEIKVKPNTEENLYPDWTGKTVLITEDEEANYYFLKEVLSRTNINIFWAKDGKQAIDTFKKEKIDVILMDIQLPVIDGYKATSVIKNINSSVPVIAQTAFAMTEDSEKCFAAGCDEYLTKPIRTKKLIALLKKYL